MYSKGHSPAQPAQRPDFMNPIPRSTPPKFGLGTIPHMLHRCSHDRPHEAPLLLFGCQHMGLQPSRLREPQPYPWEEETNAYTNAPNGVSAALGQIRLPAPRRCSRACPELARDPGRGGIAATFCRRSRNIIKRCGETEP